MGLLMITKKMFSFVYANVMSTFGGVNHMMMWFLVSVVEYPSSFLPFEWKDGLYAIFNGLKLGCDVCRPSEVRDHRWRYW